MFKNRSIEMKVVKTPKGATAPVERPRMQVAEIQAIVNYNAKRVALAIAAGYALKTVLDTGSDIAMHTAHTKIK